MSCVRFWVAGVGGGCGCTVVGWCIVRHGVRSCFSLCLYNSFLPFDRTNSALCSEHAHQQKERSPGAMNSQVFFFHGVNNEGTPSQGLTYKRIYFFYVHKKEFGTQLKQNNDWGHEAFRQKSFLCVSCIVCTAAEDASPRRRSASYNFAWLTCLHSAPAAHFQTCQAAYRQK